jgi:hypothetical protein
MGADFVNNSKYNEISQNFFRFYVHSSKRTDRKAGMMTLTVAFRSCFVNMSKMNVALYLRVYSRVTVITDK